MFDKEELAQIFKKPEEVVAEWFKTGQLVTDGVDQYWRYPTNSKLISIRILVQARAEQKNPVPEEKRSEILKAEIDYYIKKYGGTYENTLKDKADKTEIELQDEYDWRFFIRELEAEEQDIDELLEKL